MHFIQLKKFWEKSVIKYLIREKTKYVKKLKIMVTLFHNDICYSTEVYKIAQNNNNYHQEKFTSQFSIGTYIQFVLMDKE